MARLPEPQPRARCEAGWYRLCHLQRDEVAGQIWSSTSTRLVRVIHAVADEPRPVGRVHHFARREVAGARCAGLRRPESQGSDRPGTGTACVETSRGRLAGDSAPRTGILPPATGAQSDIRHAAVTAVDAVDVRRVRRRCGVRRPRRASAACAIRPTSRIPPVGHRWVHCRLVPRALGR